MVIHTYIHNLHAHTCTTRTQSSCPPTIHSAFARHKLNRIDLHGIQLLSGCRYPAKRARYLSCSRCPVKTASMPTPPLPVQAHMHSIQHTYICTYTHMCIKIRRPFLFSYSVLTLVSCAFILFCLLLLFLFFPYSFYLSCFLPLQLLLLLLLPGFCFIYFDWLTRSFVRMARRPLHTLSHSVAPTRVLMTALLFVLIVLLRHPTRPRSLS